MVDSSCARHGFAPNRLRLIATASGLMTESASRSSRSTHASTPGLAPEHAAMLRRGDSRLGGETPVNGASRANPEFRRGTVTRRWLGYPIPVLSEAVCPERFHRCLLRQCSVSHENASLARFAGPTRPGASAVARATPPHVRIVPVRVAHAASLAAHTLRACDLPGAARRRRSTARVPLELPRLGSIAWRATSRLRPPRWWRSERGDSNPRPPVSFHALYRLSRPPGRLVCAGWRATR